MSLTADDYSFGTLLQAFRKRQRLTQQALAEALGLHRRSLVRWEQGDYLPDSKKMVLELARYLKLNDQEARQLLEASLTALAPYWSVPLPRNPFFTGREEILEVLHAQLGTDRTVALTQSSALHGLGGIGKTQIALEYAYRHALEYSAVFWIGAETDENIIASWLHIAETLQLPEREDKDQQRVVAAVQRWLSTHGQWLLIWDNVEDLALLGRFLPTMRSGAMLITTRRQALGTLARGLDLLPMAQEEGILFLLRRMKVLEPEATGAQMQQFAEHMPVQYAAAADLMAELGGLPLALDQAGAYIEETRCGLSAYLDLFRARRDVLLQRRGEEIHDHPASVSTTFTLAITAVTERHPAVKDLLQACALLQPDAIPEELFRQGGLHLGAELAAVTGSDLAWNQLMASACGYSLLARQPEQQTLSLHRLVQAVVLATMQESERVAYLGRNIQALESVFPTVGHQTGTVLWKPCERLLPHALLYVQYADGTAEPLACASLMYKVARYLRLRGQYVEAGVLLQRALHLRKQTLGEAHPDVAAALHYLAECYREQGNYEQAEPLFHQALHILEQALGSDHPEIVTPLGNLAILFAMQGKYEQATSFLLRTLRINEQVWGSDHPQVATPLINLAAICVEQGDDAQAVSLNQRALHILTQGLGADHPQVAIPLTNLASIYTKQGKYEQAALLLQQALSIRERVLGASHPLAAASLSTLASLYVQQGNDEQAEHLYQRALTIREQQLGSHHPDTGTILHDLALFRQYRGRHDEAITLARRAFTIRSQALGERHPHTIATQTLYTQLIQQDAQIEQAQAAKQ